MRGNTPLAVLQREIVGSYETRQNQEQSIFPFIDIFLKKIKIFFSFVVEIVFLFCLECSSPLFGHMFAFLLPPRNTFSQTSCRLSFRYRGWHLKTSDSTQNIDKILRCHIFDSSWQIPSQKRYRQSFPEEHCLLPSLFFFESTKKRKLGWKSKKG